MNYFVRVDHIGRPVFATNASGAKVWTAAYLPFGGVRTSTGTPITLRFPGQWFQSENGLYQNWMRDYDPTTGRYLQADPLGLVDGVSVYGYVKQNPGRWVDPKGEDSDALTPGVIAVIGAMCTIDGPLPIGDVLALGLTAYVLLSPAKECNCSLSEGEQTRPPVSKENPPTHPDFKPAKNHPDIENIPWMGKGRKGYKDRSGDYWEPIPGGHGGTHAPHWDVQHPNGTHTPKYP